MNMNDISERHHRHAIDPQTTNNDVNKQLIVRYVPDRVPNK